jgi:ferredoxin-type protein NapH
VIDERTLAWNHDEEAPGFGQPRPTTVRPPIPQNVLAARGALTLVAIGLLALVVQFFGGALTGRWSDLSASLGALTLGTLGHAWLVRRGAGAHGEHDGLFFRGLTHRGGLAWLAGVLMTGFYVLLYWFPETLQGLVRLVDPLAQALRGSAADHWFLYGTLYTLAVLAFGVRMLLKYRHNRYQQWRTASVMTAQLGFAFLIPNVLKAFSQPEFYPTYFWPLKAWYGEPDGVHSFWSQGAVGKAMILFAAGMILIGTPLLTWRFGKRWYCSWVCGCGGLAETLGDPFRQLSDKSRRAWKIERLTIHAVLVWVVAMTGLLWFNSWRRGEVLGEWSHPFAKAYGFWIGALFSGVVGVGFYPLMGSRVWCRFGCPMAAILGILQRLFSRFRITTNGGQCMSCGNCSTYCEMGIDVRAYAQRGENVVRASCVGCGVCAAVCPRGVLRLENGLPADRFEGAGDPWGTFLDSVKRMQEERYAAWDNAPEPRLPG